MVQPELLYDPNQTLNISESLAQEDFPTDFREVFLGYGESVTIKANQMRPLLLY